MHWNAKIISVTNDPSMGWITVAAELMESDDDGAVVYVEPRKWGFSTDNIPTPEAIQIMLSNELDKFARTRGVAAVYGGLQGYSVSMTTTPPIFPTTISELSQADKRLIEMKATVKPDAIGYMKTHPECTSAEVSAHIASLYGEPFGAITGAMAFIYTNGAFNAGLIAENTFEAFRDFVVATSIDQLMAL